MIPLRTINPNTAHSATGTAKPSRMSLGGARLDLELGGPRRASAVPNRRQTLASGAPSSAGADPSRRQTLAAAGERRQSSGRGVPSQRSAKDSRPDPKDPQIQRESKMKIMDHLVRRGHQVNKKMLNSPSQQDFLAMFEWLWREIDPNMKLSDKPEEQIPGLLQWIKYPTSVTKSQLKSVGSPHVWPNILAALRWLVELVEFTDAVYQEQDAIHDEEERSARMFFESLCKGYRGFLEGEDDDTKHEEELRRTFDERNASEIEAIRSLRERNDAIRREIAALRDAPDRIDELDRRKEGFIGEIERLNQNIERQKETQHGLFLRLKEATDHHDRTEKNIRSFNEQKEELEVRISKQDMSAVDVDRMNMDKKKLEDDLEALESKKEKIDKTAFETEVEIQRKLAELEKMVVQLNNASTLLSLIPPSAKNAKGNEYEVRLNHHATSSKELLSLDLKAALLVEVHALKDKFNAKFYACHQRRLELSSRLTDLEGVVADRQDDSQAIQEKLKALQADHDQEKERWAAKLVQMEKEIDSVIQETYVIQDQTRSALEKSQRALEASTKQLQEVELSCATEAKFQTDALISVCSMAIEYKDHVAANLQILSDHFEKLKASDLP